MTYRTIAYDKTFALRARYKKFIKQNKEYISTIALVRKNSSYDCDYDHYISYYRIRPKRKHKIKLWLALYKLELADEKNAGREKEYKEYKLKEKRKLFDPKIMQSDVQHGWWN